MSNIKTIDDVPSIIQYTPLEKVDDQEKVSIYLLLFRFISQLFTFILKNWKELYFKFINEINDKSENEVDSIITSIVCIIIIIYYTLFFLLIYFYRHQMMLIHKLKYL